MKAYKWYIARYTRYMLCLVACYISQFFGGVYSSKTENIKLVELGIIQHHHRATTSLYSNSIERYVTQDVIFEGVKSKYLQRTNGIYVYCMCVCVWVYVVQE